MLEGTKKLPVIQKTKEDDLLNVDGHPFARDKKGLYQVIDEKTFDKKLKKRELVIWDCT